MNDIGRTVGGWLNNHPGWAALGYYLLGFAGGVCFALIATGSLR